MSLRGTARLLGGIAILLVRAFTLWVFLVPSILAWLMSLILRPVAQAFGQRIPATPRYYAVWATMLHDALVTRVLPVTAMPWPWQVAVGDSRIRTYTDAY